MVWYIRAMLLSSSETSEKEQTKQFCKQRTINGKLSGFIHKLKENVSDSSDK